MTHPGDPWAPPVPTGARIVSDPDELRDFYSDAPAVHLYALVDLELPWWPLSRWYRRGDAVVGLISDTPGLLLTAYAVSTRDPAGSIALLAELVPSLPSGLLLTGPTGMVAACTARRPVAWSGPHHRYELVDRPVVEHGHTAEVDALGPADLADLVALYASEPGAAFFLPSMLDDATFVGVRQDGVLVAAAGTHLISASRRLAAIGAVYVRPSARGSGLGAAVTSGVIARLDRRVDTIGLNVAADNTPAITIYERLGFRRVLDYDEVQLA